MGCSRSKAHSPAAVLIENELKQAREQLARKDTEIMRLKEKNASLRNLPGLHEAEAEVAVRIEIENTGSKLLPALNAQNVPPLTPRASPVTARRSSVTAGNIGRTSAASPALNDGSAVSAEPQADLEPSGGGQSEPPASPAKLQVRVPSEHDLEPMQAKPAAQGSKRAFIPSMHKGLPEHKTVLRLRSSLEINGTMIEELTREGEMVTSLQPLVAPPLRMSTELEYVSEDGTHHRDRMSVDAIEGAGVLEI